MASESSSFEVGIEFSSVLAAISKQIYDTPYAFLRENLQNAIDASRMQAGRELISPSDASLRIDINVQGDSVRIRDRGNGMSSDDLRTCTGRLALAESVTMKREPQDVWGCSE